MNAYQIGTDDPYSVHGSFESDFYVVSRGDPALPLARKQAEYAVETALWGYKQIRTRPFYWVDKKKLIERILRSTNIALWQRKREPGFASGVSVDVVCMTMGPQRYWIGATGNSFFYETVHMGSSPEKVLQIPWRGKGLGVERYKPEWNIYKGNTPKDQSIILALVAPSQEQQRNDYSEEQILSGWKISF